MKKLRSIVLPLFTSMILASCGSGLEGVTGGNPPPTPPAPPTLVFIPQAGAPVNSGNGTVIGTVRISPNAQEVEMLKLVNEVRTKGTINGQDTIKGSCVEASFKPGTLNPVTYDGMLSYAVRKHTVYMTESGEYGHNETDTSHPDFFATRSYERNNRARQMFGQPEERGTNEIIVIMRSNAAQATSAWMMSPGHCQALMGSSYSRVGVGYTQGRGTGGTDSYRFDSWAEMFAN